MVIVNGTIEFITKTEGGLDDNGYPIKPERIYGEPIPCQYTASSHNLLAKSEGEHFVQQNYTILVEHLHPCQKTEEIRLRDRWGKIVKEAPVERFEPLDAVCQMRIYL